eukprot:scaffold152972_cov17-Tisochrysis_lutea.AAC.2
MVLCVYREMVHRYELISAELGKRPILRLNPRSGNSPRVSGMSEAQVLQCVGALPVYLVFVFQTKHGYAALAGLIKS